MDINSIINNCGQLSFSELNEYTNDLLSLMTEKISDLDIIKKVYKADKRKNVQKLAEKIEKKIFSYTEEVKRVKNLYTFDKIFGTYKYIAGVDEVGRGPVAGPIVGAAVILDLDDLRDESLILGINDSKKLSAAKRKELSILIKSKAISYSIAELTNEDIDSKGIAFCNNQIFIDACAKLSIKPELVLSDGYPVKHLNIDNKFVIKGDTKSASIACASIIAKVYRDELMSDYDNIYPNYNFSKHVGYGTKEHMDAILQYGMTPIHRKSFLTNLQK